jgi:hypothetical protein
MAKHIMGIELANQLQRNIQYRLPVFCQGRRTGGVAVIKNKSVVAKWLSCGCLNRIRLGVVLVVLLLQASDAVKI